MPSKNFLRPRQKEQLQKALRESDSPDFRERVLILLLMNDGKTYQEITDFLGCSYQTVIYWCDHGDPDNLESLRNQEESGNLRLSRQENLPPQPQNIPNATQGNLSRKWFFPKAIQEKSPPQPETSPKTTQENSPPQLWNIRKARPENSPLFNVKALEDSFALVKAQQANFSASFYKNLFTANPKLRVLFANTPMEEQEKKLMMALVLIINNLRHLAYLKTLLKDLGERHIRYGAIPEYYPMVGAALLKTLESYLGPEWTPEVKQAWTDGYEAVAGMMLAQD